jgi:hypothetical protein
VGTKYAEAAVQHVPEGKRRVCSRAQAGEHKILSRSTDGGPLMEPPFMFDSRSSHFTFTNQAPIASH